MTDKLEGVDGKIQVVSDKTLPAQEPVEASAVVKDNGMVIELSPKKPWWIWFILGNEFCERFCFYGMKSILPLYLTSWLQKSEDRATSIIHFFIFAAYFFTLFGGVLSDNFLGKFWTILWLSIVYICGSTILALTAIKGATGTPPHAWGCYLGLALLALGTGGIKPCVGPFGADQYDGVKQAKQQKNFFAIFYIAINAGSLLSMFLTPLLKSVPCFGEKTCYPLGFGVPAILLVVAVVVFVVGAKWYVQVPVTGGVSKRIVGVWWLAFKRKVLGRGQTGTEHMHMLEHAQPEYQLEFIRDVQQLGRLIKLFLPVGLFWALYDQQGSRWTYQALLMNPAVTWGKWSFKVKAEQMGLVNAFLILALTPLFTHAVYPAFKAIGCNTKRGLPKMLWGMGISGLSFLVAAILQYAIVNKGTFAVSPDDPNLTVCTEGCVHIAWQIPQYIVITVGEVLFSVTGLDFAYSQAPKSMRSIVSALWLLTVAAGNLIVLVMNELDPVRRVLGKGHKQLQAWNFVMWAIILGLGLCWFGFAAYGWNYFDEEPTTNGDLTEPEAAGMPITKSRD